MSDEIPNDEPIILYPFRRRDPLSGKWYRARYKVSEEQLAQNEGEWIVDGPPEVHRSLGPTSGFQPRPPPPRPVRLLLHPQREMPPAIDKLERFLALTFLRRHVTYCVRRRRFAQAQAAANLHREIARC
jgi:hypothetical protein